MPNDTYQVSLSYPFFCVCKYSWGVQKYDYNLNNLTGCATQIGVLSVSYLFNYISVFCDLLNNDCNIIPVSGPTQ